MDENRGLFRHEVFHGLGFVNSMFNYARDSQGERKHLIELKPVVDNDGATDEVWYFVRGRAFELAQAYFQCHANVSATYDASDAWHGLPLMGLPEAGRGAHWETRIMRDDVMSYGFRAAISSITLAAMEDLGFYLANYTSADCMTWGFKQGCAYVKSRCGTGVHDSSSLMEHGEHSETNCRGDPFWAQYQDSYLGDKCADGFAPCLGDNNGYVPRDGSIKAQCDAQCHWQDGLARADCNTPPAGAIEGTGVLGDISNLLNTIDWQAWLIPAVWLIGICTITRMVRNCVCPKSKKDSRKIAYSLAIGSTCLWACGLGGAAYLYVERRAYAPFVNMTSIIVGAASSAVLMLFALLMICALYSRATKALRLGFYILVLFAMVEVAFVLLLAYWIYSLGAVPTDALVSLLGDAHRHIDTFLARVLDQPVAVTEGVVCKMYQLCCRDPALDEISTSVIDEEVDVIGSGEAASGYTMTNGTGVVEVFTPPDVNTTGYCLAPAQHAGAVTDLENTMRDPSTEHFCAYTSGAPEDLLFTPPLASCALLERLSTGGDSFSLSACRSDFCASGTDGYLDFLQLVVTMIQRHALPLGAGMALLVVVQLIFAFNLRRTAFHAAATRAKRKAKRDPRYVTQTYTEQV